LPTIEREGVHLRVIAGTAFGKRSPVAVFSETLYVDAALKTGSQLELTDEHRERAIYVAEGRIALDGAEFAAGRMIVLDEGTIATIRATAESRLLLLGGAPVDGPRHIWWNFVASSRERIDRAREDWKAQRFAKVPGETEFIPLPETGWGQN
jgi:redox-sensitive bicupin YhaK (pirin superfamily)